eukprot:7092159-Prymnesium_polylepis.2
MCALGRAGLRPLGRYGGDRARRRGGLQQRAAALCGAAIGRARQPHAPQLPPSNGAAAERGACRRQRDPDAPLPAEPQPRAPGAPRDEGGVSGASDKQPFALFPPQCAPRALRAAAIMIQLRIRYWLRASSSRRALPVRAGSARIQFVYTGFGG